MCPSFRSSHFATTRPSIVSCFTSSQYLLVRCPYFDCHKQRLCRMAYRLHNSGHYRTSSFSKDLLPNSPLKKCRKHHTISSSVKHLLFNSLFIFYFFHHDFLQTGPARYGYMCVCEYRVFQCFHIFSFFFFSNCFRSLFQMI